MRQYVYKSGTRLGIGHYIFGLFAAWMSAKMGFNLINESNLDLLPIFLLFLGLALLFVFLIIFDQTQHKIDGSLQRVSSNLRWFKLRKKVVSISSASAWSLDILRSGPLQRNYKVMLKSSNEVVCLGKFKAYEDALILGKIAYELLPQIHVGETLRSDFNQIAPITNRILNPVIEPKWFVRVISYICPVENDVPAGIPWITFLVTGAIASISILAFNSVIDRNEFGFVPSRPLKYGGATLLTFFFLHAGWFHLIGNLISLGTFGRGVELHLGRSQLLFVLLLTTIAAGVAEALISSSSEIPIVGASGGIFGLISYYLLNFPNNTFHWSTRFSEGTFKGWHIAMIYLIFQLIGLPQQLNHHTNIAIAAHLGGAMMGALIWACQRIKNF